MNLCALFSESALIYRLNFGARWKQYVENSIQPVYLELYTARRFRKLFPDCQIKISKHQCFHLRFAVPVLGWYLVGKGTKPDK